jgi:hypothetical protein
MEIRRVLNGGGDDEVPMKRDGGMAETGCPSLGSNGTNTTDLDSWARLCESISVDRFGRGVLCCSIFVALLGYSVTRIGPRDRAMVARSPTIAHHGGAP